ncbi:unnamed protein product [Periconia digitata]|uniref:Uncharacterized protein n=1 Tax=Periconia digitata TaxID=1303443 RepID=A0A9W4U6Y2_9PLEO|nr:unnamed protein product [Periconia digitata]
MVESPAVSTADSPFETGDATLSTPASTPQPVKTSPLHAHLIQTGSKHASPIVRLKGTVSPTSSTFKRNAFVPASIEQGPIGPGLLKSRSTSAHSPPRQSTTPPPPVAQLDEVLNVSPPKPPTPKEPPPQQDDFSAFDTSTPEPTTSPPTPSPPSNPEKNTAPITTTSWGEDADFSIFESSIPQTSMPPTIPPSTSTPDPTDPWSIFNTPPPSRGTPTAEDSLSGSFARPSSREQSPPTLQPPMTATNSAQRRKDEEDELIRGIVAGLPDLGYMLRR